MLSRIKAGPAVIGVALAVLAALFFWEVLVTGPLAIDDSYLTFTFSKNLASGHGPVYGHGVRVEGYSNFLWMVIVGIGLFLRPAADPMLVARLAAAPFALLLLLAAYRLGRVRAPWPVALALVATLVANADLARAFRIGLETLPYTALLCAAFGLYVTSLRDPRLQRWVVPAFVLVALCRIDGVVPLTFIVVWEAARRRLARQGTVGDLVRWAAPGLICYAVWFAWRWSYYGMLLPSTYYAKALIPKAFPLRGVQYVGNEMLGAGWWLALPFAVVLLMRGGAAGRVLVAFVITHLLYVCKVGGDWMPYGRFVLPVVPLLLVIIAWGTTLAAEVIAERRSLTLRAQTALMAALIGSSYAVIAQRTERHLTTVRSQRNKVFLLAEQQEHVDALKVAARFLNLALRPGARLVTDYGGVMGYYTDAAPIEMWGLGNAVIARRGNLENVNALYGRTCPACYPELQPEFFHVMMPLLRPPGELASHADVVAAVWQTDTIGRYLNFQDDFVAGRVLLPGQEQALFFLEKRHADRRYLPRQVGDDTFVDYPFVPDGRLPGS